MSPLSGSIENESPDSQNNRQPREPTMSQSDTLDPRLLGLRISEARRARGKTQEEVADYLGCRRPTYIAIEKGDRLAKAAEIVK
ncbi:MAG: helix-turn-helix transcriptional regulator, partial [bacterium]